MHSGMFFFSKVNMYTCLGTFFFWYRYLNYIMYTNNVHHVLQLPSRTRSGKTLSGATWSWRSDDRPCWSSSVRSRSVWLPSSARSRSGRNENARSRSAAVNRSSRSSWKGSESWRDSGKRSGARRSRGERWAVAERMSGRKKGSYGGLGWFLFIMTLFFFF